MNTETLLGDLIANHKAEIIDRAVENLADRLAETCLPSAKELADTTMRAKVDELIASKLQGVETKSFRRTDSYGQPRDGTAITLVELIQERAVKWLEERVDRDGRTNYGQSRDRSRAEWLASKAADAMIRDELDPAIKEAKEALAKTINGKLAEAFTDSLKRLLK